MNQIPAESIEQIEIDPRIAEYEKKIANFANLLGKAKIALDTKTKQFNQKLQEAEESKQTIKHLEDIVNKYLNEDSKERNFSQVKKILACVSIESINWLCVRSGDNIEWIREDSYKSWAENEEASKISNGEGSQDAAKITFPECLDYNEVLEKKIKDEKQKVNYQEDLTNVIKQYETRISRIQTYYENTEKKLAETSEENKRLIQRIDSNKEELNKIASKIVDESEEIRENCLIYLNEESDENSKNDCMNKMKILLLQLQKMNFDYEFTSINLVKDHILVLHQTLFEVLKKLNNVNLELNHQEKTWRETCNALIAQKESEEKKKKEVIEESRRRIKEGEGRFEELKLESAKIIKEKELKIDFLSKELKKNINTQYIKNILLKFFSSDTSVQEKTLNVITTVLQFTPEETESLNTSWRNQNKSKIEKFLGNFGFSPNNNK